MSDTLHVTSLPHTATDGTFTTCAYTERVRKFCKAMTGRGRRVVLYGSELNTAPCDEHVVVVTEERRQELFGPQNEGDLNRGGFDWNYASVWWAEMNARTAGAIRERACAQDLLCITAGQAQSLIADFNPELIAAEIMVGYEGIFNVGGHQRRGNHAFAAFESQSHRHLVYGRFGMQNRMNERWYDAVIPNSFDPDDFPEPDRAARRRAERRGSYALFVGRLIANKGPHVAAQIADALDMPLVVAGPGADAHGEGWVNAPEIKVAARRLEYVGAVGAQERSELMHGAAVLLMPTLYVEPFGGVAVEAMMAGCPVVSPDWGAFTETVKNGVSGFRFHTLEEGVDAARRAMDLDRDVVREYARAHYSLDAAAAMYDEWFDRLDSISTGGWASLPATV